MAKIIIEIDLETRETKVLTEQDLLKYRGVIYRKIALTMDQVIDVLCEYFQVTKEELLNANTGSKMIFPRKIACYYLSCYYEFALSVVARKLGYNQHNTVKHHKDDVIGLLESGHIEIVRTIRDLNNRLGITK